MLRLANQVADALDEATANCKVIEDGSVVEGGVKNSVTANTIIFSKGSERKNIRAGKRTLF